MKKLSENEIAHVSGGRISELLVGVGIGIGANYVYESIGGREGINNYFSNSWSSIKSSVRYNTRRLRRTFRLNQPQ